MTRVILSKLSVCDCGYTLLHEHIPLGTEFMIEENRRDGLTLRCGGCGKWTHDIPAVFTYHRGQKQGGDFLPSELFTEA